MGRRHEVAAHLLLADKPFSRNRHFEAHRDPRFRRGIALYRRLRAIVADLEQASGDDQSRIVVTRETSQDRPRVRLDIHTPPALRTSFLEEEEWQVLLRHPCAQAALGEPEKNDGAQSDVGEVDASGLNAAAR